MTSKFANPFASLYVTETIDPTSFVRVFSPHLVNETLSLYQPGNVILMGTQGSGKSMLLTLLKPETRLAYQQEGEPFPLAGHASPFIGAGINLTRSGAIDFGQRRTGDDPRALEAYFGDFLNYWIVRDLLQSIRQLGAARGETGLAVDVDTETLDAFARTLAGDDCWAGAMGGVQTIKELDAHLTARIRAYRDFFNYNTEVLPDDLTRTKTSAGEPISVAADALREGQVVGDDVELFVRVDQYEELDRLTLWQTRGEDGDLNFASVIHKMLGLRDRRVSYRIGTRRHAWPDQPRMQGTAAVLEELRNFKLVDLDDLLRDTEHRHPFGPFAEDVFRRRVQWAGYDCPDSDSCIGAVLGKTPPPEERAQWYVRSGSYTPLGGEGDYGSAERLIKDLAEKDPLDARLAEAYVLQNGPEKAIPDDDGKYPWVSRPWWRKERVGLALLQIAARQRQRMVWCGKDDVLRLAGGNVLVFVSLCQYIWDTWLATQSIGSQAEDGLPTIEDPYVQNEGIHRASRYWYRKIRSDPQGDMRQRFVNALGEMFREWLRSDTRLSYPGHNGFSLAPEDLQADSFVNDFLKDAAAFGVLDDRVHTNKERRGGERQKWYLAPIYAPQFQIPVAKVKEPRYVKVSDVREWLESADVIPSSGGPHRRVFDHSHDQRSLFD